MITVSVIIPIYNVEKYLSECISSIIKYKENNLEIILIDDGSTDSSGVICDRWRQKDHRIKVIHKANGGLSDARNAGIECARGKYYFFLDSDDYILEIDDFQKAVEYLIEFEPEILLINSRKIYEKSADRKSKFGIDTDTFEKLTVEEAIAKGLYHACAWNKIIRADILNENNIRFPKGRLSEDIEYCGEILSYVKHITVFYKPLYQYRIRKGSISNTLSKKRLYDIFEMIDHGIKGKENNLKKNFFSYEYAVLLGISKSADQEFVKKIYSLEELLDYGERKKVRLVKKVKDIFGIKMTRRILILFVSVKNVWKI